MNIHEYQGKELFRKYGVAVPRGGVASTPEEAERVATELGGAVAVKAQIHAGGRGKGGGIQLAKSPAEARQAASRIIGMTLVTHQTGPQGRLVKKVWVEEASQIERELYLSIVLDRAAGRPTIMASTEGGMDIEEVAAKTPEKLLKVPVDPALGAWPSTARRVAYGLGLTGALAGEAVKFLTSLYRFYSDMDCSLVEINPLIQTKDGRILALDAKVNFDDNALFRHPDVAALRDLDEEDPLEVEASKHSLNYIKLDGEVGCMVNGAGLAMATMDIIKLSGASPANFLDVGGGASREMVENAFRILMSDKAVRAVLINIFGGILRCDVLAQGVVDAVKTVNVNVPIVIRMEGTNVDKGREILRTSGLDFTVADGMADAAKKVVAALDRTT
ncbi:MAG: ADP-forming succinate--CoA ligase subunit beta [Candidatus Tectomicrobia bacterium]|uniref:Succinate--CoA ligase [ADP-forming] subunit beta n=1 Tax=Tectimicrobiota bacterium TaxID=2528274 RepID=A0A932I1Y8_UNCTE|nr:ADP-forming succinate--CoA ligase subunit beta [Candidatus Tectomicrobia bacterium]